jgi:hypothetical protein
MKKLHRFTVSTPNRLMIRTPVLLLLVAASAISIWFAIVSTGMAAPPMMCTVCHKHVATLSLPCGGIAYRRHKDHGDPDGACGATTSNTFLDPLKPSRTQPNQPQQQ